MIAVIDCPNLNDLSSCTIYVYHQKGAEAAQQKFFELVAEDLADRDNLTQEEAVKKAEDYLVRPGAGEYTVGDSVIILTPNSVFLMDTD